MTADTKKSSAHWKRAREHYFDGIVEEIRALEAAGVSISGAVVLGNVVSAVVDLCQKISEEIYDLENEK